MDEVVVVVVEDVRVFFAAVPIASTIGPSFETSATGVTTALFVQLFPDSARTAEVPIERDYLMRI